MKIYITGNSIVPEDNGPIMLMPKLMELLPECEYIKADPTENFIPEDGSLIVDTVTGIERIQLFDDIYQFSSVQHVSMHDFDLSFHLRFLDKLHKLARVQIIGIPQYYATESAAREVADLIRTVIKEREKK